MYSAAFLDHFERPRGRGSLPGATHRGAAENAACGDRLALDLRVDEGRILDARYRVRGCAGAIAAGSALAAALPGRAARSDAVTRAELDAALGSVPPTKRHALRLALDALAAALPGPVSPTG